MMLGCWWGQHGGPSFGRGLEVQSFDFSLEQAYIVMAPYAYGPI